MQAIAIDDPGICESVCHVASLCKNSRTDRGLFCVNTTGGPWKIELIVYYRNNAVISCALPNDFGLTLFIAFLMVAMFSLFLSSVPVQSTCGKARLQSFLLCVECDAMPDPTDAACLSHSL